MLARVRSAGVLWQHSVTVELLTRQFGGGSVTRQAEPDLWLRPAAVRGALRFFWRALYAHEYRESKDLWLAESALFGRAANEQGQGPGRLQVCVDLVRRSETAAWDATPGDALSVAYFPAQDMGQERADLLLPGARARIRLSSIRGTKTGLSELQQEQVMAALRAFIILGGSGARTRRAAGAVSFATMAEAKNIGAPTSLDELRGWLRSLPRQRCAVRCFSLADRDGIYLAPRGSGTAEGAQRVLLELWRDFRQDRPHPSKWEGKSGWGRTTWPEADAVRIASETHAEYQNGVTHAPQPDHRGKAPRSHLGLPLILKFKDDERQRRAEQRVPAKAHPVRGPLRRCDPDSTEIANQTGRYGSPVLLGVTRVADSGPEAYHGLVIVTPSLLEPSTLLRPDRARLRPGPWDEVKARLEHKLREHRFISLES